ncbi:CrcB family protein [Nocardioides sp. InS609-2]|uniref:fluoride efflux transporter FluC n=1 Tax=Nocardioides sp. InS609-2 TaxID=2760705 RepID=UPI0020BD83AC|nr:CrcB family protein [Nocardioides sp. InS609-2]
MIVLLVALGAAVGAPARYAISHLLDDELPVGTLLVNVLGSTLLGFLSAVAPGEHALALLGVGLCGGFTTWSSLAVQTHDRGWSAGSRYLVLTLALAMAGCTIGFVVGTQA